jgi:uncharacterized protein with PIN domain
MPHAQFYFDPHLSRFLPEARHAALFDFPFEGHHRSVKDMIEAAGVPHTEVGRIVVNGARVDFGYHVVDGDSIAVYPLRERDTDDDEPATHPTAPTIDRRFVADVHLGRLVAHLRMLGFDTLYPDDYRDEELARIAASEDRILLTRDIGLLKRRQVRRGHFVRATDPWEQLAEVVSVFNLRGQIVPFYRCTICNGRLEPVSKDAIAEQLPPRTLEYYDDFRRCLDCGKLYWKGSHYARLEAFLANLNRD